jgi:hypothetical protein
VREREEKGWEKESIIKRYHISFVVREREEGRRERERERGGKERSSDLPLWHPLPMGGGEKRITLFLSSVSFQRTNSLAPK